MFQPISELLGLPLLQLFCKDGLSAEQAVAAAAALSAQEKQAVRRDMKWHAVFRLAAALTLSAALVYVSRVLDLHGIYGWPQGCTMGMLPFTGWLAGDAVFTLKKALTGWKNAKRPGAVAPGLLVSAAPDYVFARDASSS